MVKGVIAYNPELVKPIKAKCDAILLLHGMLCCVYNLFIL